MELSLIEQNGQRLLTGVPGQPLLHAVADTAQLIEACFEQQASGLLLYAENLPPDFFDLNFE
jgi:hypothetical protein